MEQEDRWSRRTDGAGGQVAGGQVKQEDRWNRRRDEAVEKEDR